MSDEQKLAIAVEALKNIKFCCAAPPGLQMRQLASQALKTIDPTSIAPASTSASVDTVKFRILLAAAEAMEGAEPFNNLIAHIDAHCAAQVAEWKANHADMVKRCAILRERDDLPVDRLPAYRELVRLQEAARATPAVGALTDAQREAIATDHGLFRFMMADQPTCERMVAGFVRAILAAASGPVESVNQPAGLANCPITGNKFWGNIDHPELGMVATYGGPLDTYTIPVRGEDDELRSERFCQDRGDWIEGGEPMGYFSEDQQAAPAAQPGERDAALVKEAIEIQRKNYGNAMMLHLDMIEWEGKASAGTAPAQGETGGAEDWPEHNPEAVTKSIARHAKKAGGAA